MANGLEVQVLAGPATDDTGTYYVQDALIYGGDVAWDVVWYGSPGNEAEDQARFLQFLNSFERLTE